MYRALLRLRLVGQETYGHDDRAINRHTEQHYEDEAGNRYVLSRTLDGVPPFFEAYGPYRPDHEGLLPRLKVRGQDYWGAGWSFARARQAFCRTLNATIKETHANH